MKNLGPTGPIMTQLAIQFYIRSDFKTSDYLTEYYCKVVDVAELTKPGPSKLIEQGIPNR